MYYPSKFIVISLFIIVFIHLAGFFAVEQKWIKSIFSITILMFLYMLLAQLFGKSYVQITTNFIKVVNPWRKNAQCNWEEFSHFESTIKYGLVSFAMIKKNGKKLYLFGYNDLDLYRTFLNKLSSHNESIEEYIQDLEYSLESNKTRIKRQILIGSLVITFVVIMIIVLLLQ